MHLSKATASLAVSVALLAGCSSSQGTSSLPSSSGVSPSLTQTHQASPGFAKSRIELLKLQAEGKLAGPVPRAESQMMFKYLSGHPRPRIKANHHGGKVVVWATNTDYGYLLGLNENYGVAQAIDTENDGCYEPITVKVDAERNGWVACEANSSFNGGAEQEYPTGKGAPATYNWYPGTSTGCPASQTCFSAQYRRGHRRERARLCGGFGPVLLLRKRMP